MLKIFKYKSLYEDAKTKCNNLSEELSGCKKNALRKQYELEKKIEDVEKDNRLLRVQLKTKELGIKELLKKQERRNEKITTLTEECNNLNKKLEEKEHERRECIGRLGGLTRAMHSYEKKITILETEKQEMLNLINKLTEEVKHLKKENKKIGGEK